ncbi:hypothetical protein JHW43_009438 [Diplocarpon mali]|nr:hypothetical protein JHW43_009438 [Diplocarpon mali]
MAAPNGPLRRGDRRVAQQQKEGFLESRISADTQRLDQDPDAERRSVAERRLGRRRDTAVWSCNGLGGTASQRGTRETEVAFTPGTFSSVTQPQPTGDRPRNLKKGRHETAVFRNARVDRSSPMLFVQDMMCAVLTFLNVALANLKRLTFVLPNTLFSREDRYIASIQAAISALVIPANHTVAGPAPVPEAQAAPHAYEEDMDAADQKVSATELGTT